MLDSLHHREDEVTPLGLTDFRGEHRRFGIRRRDRRAHLYILGRTGMGKSTLLENLIASDLRAGNGLALLEPHGDLARKVLSLVPEERAADLIDFNPAIRPLGFNPLQGTRDPARRHLVASSLLAVFKKVWAEFWGPRMEHIFRHALLTLLECPGATLLDVPKLLTDGDFRRGAVRHVSDKRVREFWWSEFAKYPAYFRSEAVAPILNKVGSLLASPIVRAVLGQRESAFRLREVMDQGKIFIATLPKGRLGEEASALLGALLITGFHMAALRRVDVSEEARRDFYLYIDEAHAFATLSLADILQEARKYRLNLILAHQYLDQLDEQVQRALLGNVGTLIVFRVGVRDAETLEKEFWPSFGVQDLVSLPRHQIYLRLMIDGVVSKAFSAETLPPLLTSSSFAER